MVKKVLIQVVSVFTLVFGTCYQSVLALADNVGQFEIHSSKVIDKEGNAVERVKAGSKQNLVFEMTINNKDGDKAAGITNVFIPENQMRVLKDKVSAESSIPDAKASLYLSKKRNLRLKWSGVNNSATFKLEVPVKIGNPMTLTDLPVAVDDATSYTQQMIVLAEDADDDAVSEAITDNDLPTNLTLQLDNYLKQVEAQKAQEAQQEADDQAQTAQEKADAAAKKAEEDEAAAKEAEEKEAAEQKAAEEKKAKEEAAAKLAEKEKLEAEEKAKAEAEAEQEKENQAAAEEKTTAKARSALKSHSDEGSEADSRSTSKDSARNLADELASAVPTGETPKSFFTSITVKTSNLETEEVVSGETFDAASYNKGITVEYAWSIDDLYDKIGKEDISAGDYYEFQVKGFASITPKSGDIMDGDKKVASFKVSDLDSEDYQTIRITFETDEGVDPSAEYKLRLSQTVSPGQTIVFEYNEQQIMYLEPDIAFNAIHKDGAFVGSDEIQWTVKLDVVDVMSSAITLTDTLGEGEHDFIVSDSEDEASPLEVDVQVQYEAKDGNVKNVSNLFSASLDSSRIMTVKGDDGSEKLSINGQLTFTFNTKYEKGDQEYKNSAQADLGTLKTGTARGSVSAASLTKSYVDFSVGSVDSEENVTPGTYRWKITSDLKKYTLEMLESLTITDTVTGPHEFNEDLLALTITANNQDVTKLFESEISSSTTVGEGESGSGSVVVKANDTLTIKIKEELSEGEKALLTNLNKGEFVVTYKTAALAGAVSEVNNGVELKVNGIISNGSSGVTEPTLVKKEGTFNYQKSIGETGAVIDWDITVNSSKQPFDSMKIVDILPEGTELSDIQEITIRGDVISLDGDDSRVEFGYSDNKETSSGYGFNSEKTDVFKYPAVKFTLNTEYSDEETKITIKTETPWSDGKSNTGYSYTNKVSGFLSWKMHSSLEYNSAKETIDKAIGDNVFKDNELNMTNDPSSTENNVQWRIGFGTRYQTTFGKDDEESGDSEDNENNNESAGTSKVSSVTINELVNNGDERYDYLTLPTEVTAYDLYEITDYKSSNWVLSEDPLERDEDYKIEIVPDSTNANKATITIEFLNTEKAYTRLALVFKTTIDLDKWQEETTQTPNAFTFANEAKVSYEGFKEETVKSTAGFSTGQMYSTKDSKIASDNDIDWTVILNADSEKLSNAEITDVLSPNQQYDVNSVKLSYVKLVREYDADKKEYKIVETTVDRTVDPDDYEVNFIGLNQFKITFKSDFELEGPILLTYTTTRTADVSSVSNEVSLKGDGYEDVTNKDATISGEVFFNRFSAVFEKIAGQTGDPVAGAKFKLQTRRKDTDEWKDHVEYGQAESNEQGLLQFKNLAATYQYRLIEVDNGSGDDTAMQPLEFDKDTYADLTTTPVIENWEVKKARLSVRKEITGNVNSQQSFKFSIQAMKKDENGDFVKDDTVHGVFAKKENATLEMNNGYAEFNISAGETETISGLPTHQPGATADEKTDIYYVVEELTTSDDFYTEITDADNQTITGKKTNPFLLRNDNDAITLYFNNIANPAGEILLKKVGENNLDRNQNFKFTISTDAKVTGTYTGTLSRPGNYNPSTSPVVFDSDGQYQTTLKAGEELLITGLPEGSYQVEEEGTDDIRTSWHTVVAGQETTMPAGKPGADVTTDAFEVKGSTTSEVTFTNKPTTTSLELEKIVSSEDSIDTEKAFVFTVDGGDALASLTARIKYSDDRRSQPFEFDKDGKATIRLTHRQRATISGLPDGTTITVTETEEKGYETSSTVTENGQTSDALNGDSRDVTVEEDKTLRVTFLNSTKPAGNLQIHKTVIGQLDTDSFNFKVTALDGLQPEGRYVVTIRDSSELISSKMLSFEKDGDNWAAEVTLAADQYALIQGLPMGSYQVEETTTDANMVTRNKITGSDWKTSTVSGEMILEDNGDLTTAHYENSAVAGHLEITKQTDTSQLNDQAFKFTVRATGNNFALTGEFKESTLNGEQHQVEFENGVMSENLKPGDVLKIAGLPVGEYEITEENQTGIVTTYTTNSGQVVGNVTTETVKKNQTSKATFTNNQTEFTLGKIVANEPDSDEEFDFTLQSWGLAGQTFTTANNGDVSFNHRGRAKVTVKAGEQLTILGLPVGARIKVVEIENENYNHATSSVINGQDSKDGRERTVTIPKNSHLLNLTFINSKNPVGALTVEKQVSGNMATETFNFEVSGLDGLKLDGAYQIQKFENGKQVGGPSTITFEKNAEGVWVAPIELKDNQYVMIIGLPGGVYNVTELDPKEEGMVTTFQLNDESIQSGMTVDTGRIEKNGDLQTVKFTNTMPEPETGNLSIQKKLTGAVTEADQNADYSFNVTAHKDGTTDSTDTNDTETETDGNETDSTATENGDKDGDATTTSTTIDTSFNGTVDAIKRTADGVEHKTQVDFTDGQASITLKAGVRLTILDIPTGTKMSVSEIPVAGMTTSNKLDENETIAGD